MGSGLPERESAAFGFRPTKLDLALATVIAIGLPLKATALFHWTGGAAASLVLYSAVCGVWVVRWRRGRLDYHWPGRWPWAVFLPSLLPAAIAVKCQLLRPEMTASCHGWKAISATSRTGSYPIA